jgi:hypothetical protein
MQCQRCGDEIEAGEERDHYGRMLCEDCYMDALSPVKTCDPWAVYTAKSIPLVNEPAALSDTQSRILDVLKETGGLEPGHLVERMGVKPTDLERDLAALRHMEKIRAELRDGKRYITLW